MSNQVPQHFVEQYRDNVIMLSQQRSSRLRAAVMSNGTVRGRTVYFDRIGPTDAVDKTTRHVATPQVNTPHSRRAAGLIDKHWADLIDWDDQLRLIYDPASPYAINAGSAMGRSIDGIVIDALGGDALEGQTGQTTVPLPAAQKIGVNYDGAGGATPLGLTTAKLRRAKMLLDQAEVDPMYKRHCVVTSQQLDNLLGTTEVSSSDYNTVKALVQGELNTWLGFNFIRTELLKILAGTVRGCYAFSEMGVGLHVGKDVETRIDHRPDLSYANQIYVCMSMGAVRREDVQVVEIACNEV